MFRDRESVSITVPSSTANMGPLFDISAGALLEPHLIVNAEFIGGNRIQTVIRSLSEPPQGRVFGYSGHKALANLRKDHRIKDGVRITYTDHNYPTGGLGRSGAEAVGAIIVAAVLFDIPLTPREIITYSAHGEAQQHMDNVAASTLGGIVLIDEDSYGKPDFHSFPVPANLGAVIGVSDHPKSQGTEGLRSVVHEGDVSPHKLVRQTRIASNTIAALVTGDLDTYLKVVRLDEFHEFRRAGIHAYGNFGNRELQAIKRGLYDHLEIAMVVSGAGPSMLFLYNMDHHPLGIFKELDEAKERFKSFGIEMDMRIAQFANTGAYHEAQHKYNYSSL